MEDDLRDHAKIGGDSMLKRRRRGLCRCRECFRGMFKNWPAFIALVIIDLRARDGPEGFVLRTALS